MGASNKISHGENSKKVERLANHNQKYLEQAQEKPKKIKSKQLKKFQL